MNKIVDHTNSRINETIVCSQRVESYNKSIDKYALVKGTNKTELNAHFGVMYFRSLLGVNLYLTDRLFSPNSHFFFSSIMSKNCFRFLRSQYSFILLCFFFCWQCRRKT